MPPRLSLTAAQVREGVGAELLALCQTVTADGVLTDAEVGELRAWLERNRGADLPAVGFLAAVVERVLADGVITADERRELHAAVEKVLPPEARRGAVAARKAVEAEEKSRAREEREAERLRPGVLHELHGGRRPLRGRPEAEAVPVDSPVELEGLRLGSAYRGRSPLGE